MLDQHACVGLSQSGSLQHRSTHIYYRDSGPISLYSLQLNAACWEDQNSERIVFFNLNCNEIQIWNVNKLVHTSMDKTMADILGVGAVCAMLFIWSPHSN